MCLARGLIAGMLIDVGRCNVSRLFKFLSRLALAATVLALCSAAQASVFSDVSESTTPPGEERFGDPTEVGDLALDFNPTNFKSLTTGPGSEIVDSQLSFTVSGVPIIGIWIRERGDFALAGIGGSSAEASVSLTVFWEVEEVDGTPLGTPLNGEQVLDVGSFSLDDGVTGGAFFGEMMVEMDAFLAGEGVSGNATRVHVTLDNNLATAASAGAAAFIAKKDFDIEIHIPEPASGSLAGLGLIGLALATRRRRRA